MIVKDTFSVTVSNFSLIFKIMIFALVLVLVFAAVFMGILSPVMGELGNAIGIQTPDKPDVNVGDGAIAEETQSLADLIRAIGTGLTEFFRNNSGTLWFAFGMFVLTAFFIRFLFGLLFVPSGKYLANKMTTGFSEGLWRTFLTVAKPALSFSFFSTLVFLVYDVGLTVLVVYLAFLLGSSIGIFAVYIAVVVLILLISLRTALTGMWLPRIVMKREKPLRALLNSFRDTKKTFVKCFTGSLAIWIILFLLTASTFVFTLGLSFVFIIPTGIVLYVAMSLVQYCHFYGQNYFRDEKTAVKIVTEDDKEE